MLKKIISSIGLMVLIAMPFIMKAQNAPQNQYQSTLESLSKDQLIQVIFCMNKYTDQRKPSALDRCITSVLPKPTVSIITPNGGEQIKIGAESLIRWKTNVGTSTPVQIYLEKIGSSIQTLIASSAANTGSYTWIPQVLPSTGTSTMYKIGIKVKSANDTASDISDSPFWVIPSTPVPRLENTAVLCSDSIDNDGDSLVDLSDTDCRDFIPVATTSPSAILTVYQPNTQNIPGTQHNTGAAVPLVHIGVKADGASTVISSITTSMLATNTPAYLQLFEGDTLLGVASTSSNGKSTFTNLNIPVQKNATKQLTVKGIFQLVPEQLTQVSVTGVSYAKTNGVYVTTPSYISGPIIYLGTKVALFKATTPSTITMVNNGTSTGSAYYLATFTGTITAKGGNATAPRTGDMDISFRSPYNSIRTASTTTITVSPNLSTIPEGSTVGFTAQSILFSRDIPASGIYNAMIDSIRWNVGGVNHYQYTDLEQFKTPVGISITK